MSTKAVSKLQGYKGRALEILSESGASIGDKVRLVLDDGSSITGILMPRYEHADKEHITLKLENGYNIGVRVSRVKSILIVERGEPIGGRRDVEEAKFISGGDVLILGTGGTIASRVDYRTGAVTAVLTPDDLYSLIPELKSIASIDTEVLFNILSENMSPEHWVKIATRVAKAVGEGYKGVVIAHGTDTMHYTASALSFALEDLPIPVVLVGSQRSSDRPSSDAALNLIAAVAVASKASFSGVYVAMHAGLSDDVVAIHRGVKVRKNHTSRRDAFQSINCSPVALVDRNGGIRVISKGLPKRGEPRDLKLRARFSRDAFLLKFFPGLRGEVIDFLVSRGYRALIIEGTGLGHVSRELFPSISGALEKKVFVGMTSQCIWGRVRLTVYDTGRDLLRMGVVPLHDMLPETALVKAMWLLGLGYDYEELVDLMPRNLRGEISERSLIKYDTYGG